MSFASPAWLGLLGLAPLVIYLHVRRRTIVEVSSLVLWARVVQASGSRPRSSIPVGSLALWLQLAALITTAIALADPMLGNAPRELRTMLVIDSGVSMSVRDTPGELSRYERAAEEIAGTARDLRGAVDVWWVGHEARPVVIAQSAGAELADRLVAIGPVHAATDWGAFESAVSLDLEVVDRLMVFTADPRAAEILAELALAHDVQLDVVPHWSPFDNLAIEAVTIERDQASGKWLVDIRVRADGVIPDRGTAPQLVATFQPDGVLAPLTFARADLSFSLGGYASTQLELDLPGKGLLALYLDHDDAVEADDRFQAWVNPSDAPRDIVVITDQPSRARALLAAIEAVGDTSVRTTSTWSPTISTDLVVVDGVSVPDLADAENRPHTVVWLASMPGEFEHHEHEWTDPGVVGWRLDHPLVRGTPWGSVDAVRALRLPDQPGAVTLAQSVGGPLVQVVTKPTRRDILVGLEAADELWTQSSAFATFIGDLVSWAAPARRSVHACTAGVACRLAPEATSGNAAIVHPGGHQWAITPHGELLPSTVEDAWVPLLTGTWQLVGSTRDSWVPVNLGLGAAHAVQESSAANLEAESPPSHGPSRAWGTVRWLVLVAALLVLVEGILAGRGTEGFWNRRAWAYAGALVRRRRWLALLHSASVAILLLSVSGGPIPTIRGDGHLLVITSDRSRALLPATIEDWPSDRLVDVNVSQVFDDVHDLEAGLRRALAHIGPHSHARVVVALGGGATRGDHLRVLEELHRRSIPVDIVELSSPQAGDVIVERIWADSAVRAGDTASIQSTVFAATETETTLRVYRDGILQHELDQTLPSGRSLVRFPLRLDHDGDTKLTIEADVRGDPEPRNNTVSTWIRVLPPPVIHVFGRPDDTEALSDALAMQGMTAVSRPPFSLGIRPSDFFGVDGVVLVDTPALTFSSLQLDALEAYVRDAAGGLVLVGGEHAFGPGGYYQTGLDRLSPLSSQVVREAPEISMVFVLDRSGSMHQQVGDTTRLEVAKHATLTAVELLGERSQVAIVVFDEHAQVLLPFTSSADRTGVEGALRPLVPGGGTSIYPGLALAVQLLEQTDSAVSHVVVMTDGLSQPGDFPGAVARIVEQGATVSTVAIGVGADVERIREIAQLGGGTAHVSTDFRALPSILAQEALMAAGDPIVRERVTPVAGDDTFGLLEGLPSEFPPLNSFVETTPKEDAAIVLHDGTARPILGAWEYGSGRVLAFTSEAVGSWASDWVEFSAFPRWWGQWVRWASQAPVLEGLDVRPIIVGDEVLVEITAVAADGTPDTSVPLQGEITDEIGFVTRRLAVEREPGRYDVRLPIQPGTATVRVVPVASPSLPSSTAMPVTHSYRATFGGGARYDELVAFALATGGSVLLPGDPSWRYDDVLRLAVTSAWKPWLIAGVVVWLIFLLVRYTPRRAYRPINNRASPETGP